MGAPIITCDGFRPAVLLRLAQFDGTPEGYSWVQIAEQGAFKGHPTGKFELNKEAFEQIIANFRRHPSYDPNKVASGPSADIVAYDFGHSSEDKPASFAVTGAPAQAWAQELEIREGANGVELWALTRWLEPARTYVREDKYKWTSVAIWPNATDPKTAESIGWYLSSIAFTNDPFIQGMVPIAACRTNCGTVAAPDHDKPQPAAPAAMERYVNEQLLKLARTLGVDVPEGDIDEAKAVVLAARVNDKVQALLLEATDSEKIKNAFGAIAKALGVEDAEGAVSRLTEMMTSLNDMKAAMPGLGSLLDGQIEAAMEEEEEDIEQVAAERRWGDDVKHLARASRSGGVTLAKGDPKRFESMSLDDFVAEVRETHKLLSAKRDARKAWQERFPRKQATEAAKGEYLLRSLSMPKSGERQRESEQATLLGAVSQHDGRNLIEKCQAYIKSTEGELSFDETNVKAVMLARSLRSASRVA